MRCFIGIAVLLGLSLQTFNVAEAQDCHIDLVFIVDQSGSICDDNNVNDCQHWRDTKQFMENVVKSLDIGLKKTRVGVVTFRSRAKVQFRLDDYKNEASLVRAIQNIPYKPWGMTNMAEGIKLANTEVFNNYGDRPTVKNIAIVISDGEPNLEEMNTIPEADAAKKTGIRFLCVGVTDEVKNDTLKHVSSSPQKLNQNFFLTPRWDGLRDVFNRLVDSACSESQELQGCSVIDLVFVVENSDNVCRGEQGRECQAWQSTIDFMLEVVNNLQIGYNDVKVGVVTFNNQAKIEFGLGENIDKLSLIQAIRDVRYAPRGSVNTADALRVARSEVLRESRVGTRRVVFLVTTSEPTSSSFQLDREVRLSNQSQVETFVLGVGSSVRDDTLREISNVNWFRRVNDYQGLPGATENLLETACKYIPPPIANDDTEGCARVDLAFVVDESGSICDNDDEWRNSGRRRCGNWEKVKKFIKDSVSSLLIGPTNVQVALIRFRSEATLGWSLGVHRNKNSLLQAIDALDYTGGGTTHTADALKMMRTEVFGAADDRPMARNVAIVITDGLPTVGYQRDNTVTEAAAARKAGVAMFVVGVTNDISEDTLKNMSSLPQELNRNYFTTPDFDSLEDKLKTLMDSACSPLESCTKDVDVAVALDMSGSVGEDNYKTMIEFVRDLVRQMRIGTRTRFALVTFNNTARIEFKLNEYDDGDDILSVLGKIPYYGGKTNTYDALRIMKEEVFIDRNGDRRNAPNVGIIITDGRSDDETKMWKEACDLRKRDVHLLAVGVGSESNQNELRSIASFPASQNIFVADDFNDLTKITYFLGVAMCNDLDECSVEPCQNGGQCHDTINGYNCECQRFSTGRNCERQCSGNADLLFIIDRSGSIPHEKFDDVKRFMVEVAGRFELYKEKVRLAALAFHDDAEVIFDFNTFKNIRNVEESILHIEYKGGKTNIASALQAARTQIFHTSTGDRRDVPNYVIMFTDGEANIRTEDTVPQGVELRLSGVHVITVGVGKHVDMDHLRGIASWPIEENIFSVGAWSRLDTLVDKAVQATCDDMNECTSNPCRNGGTCVDGLGQYLCVCPGDKSGRNCDRTCMKKLDVAFVVDISGSPENLYGSAMKFVREIVHGLEMRGDTARVALLTYAGEATTLFYLNKYDDKNKILDAISFPRTGGNTNMQAALAKVKRDIFNSNNGDRRDVDNKVILLTDGCSEESTNTISNANSLKQDSKVDVHVVAIGDRVDLQEASLVASQAKEPYLFEVRKSEDVTAASLRLLDHLCKW